MDGLYNTLLFGVVTDTKDLAASAMDFAPGVWSDPLLDSENGFKAVVFENAFARADFFCSEFPHISKKEHPPISFADVERSQSTIIFGTTLTMPRSAVCGIRMHIAT